MRPGTRRCKRRRKKGVAGSADALRFIGMQETAELQREIDRMDGQVERLQYENNALYQEKIDAEFHAYNAIVLKELYAQELVKAGIPLPEVEPA